MKMTKKEFAEFVASEYDTTKTAAYNWVNAIFEALELAVLDNDEVSIYGFGRFEKKVRAPKKGRMPSGEIIDIPAHTKIKFTPSVYLNDAIRDELDSVAFLDRMEKIRAINRGECVPGYKLVGERLIKED